MTNADLEAWRNNAAGFQGEKGQQSFGISLEREIEIPQVLAIIGDPKGKNVLDAGCGDGEFKDLLYKKGAKVIGLDGSESQLKQATEAYPGNQYLLADLTKQLPFGRNSFDAIVSRFVLMFIDNVNGLAQESSRILRPNGKFIFTITHPFYPYLQTMLGQKTRYSGLETYGEKVWGQMQIGENIYPFHFRPIEYYIKSFLETGFSLSDFREIIPSNQFIDQSPKLERMREKPVFLTLGFKNNK